MNLDGSAIGGEGEGEEGRKGDREEGVDEKNILTAEGLGPGAGVNAEKLLHSKVEGELLGLVEKEDLLVALQPGCHGLGDEAVNVEQQAGVAGEGEGEGVEPLVPWTQPHQQQRVPAEQRAYGGRVAALHHRRRPALPTQHQAVEVRVRGEHGTFAEDMRGEEPPMAPHPLGDEGLGVLCLVGGDQLERLPNQRQPHAARGEFLSCSSI